MSDNGRDNTISTFFLCGGCQTGADVAHRLARYVSQAQHTIDIAAYSFSLCPETRDIVIGALQERAAAGVRVRIAYDAGTQQSGMPYHQDPCDFSTGEFMASIPLHTRPVEGYRALACLPELVPSVRSESGYFRSLIRRCGDGTEGQVDGGDHRLPA